MNEQLINYYKKQMNNTELSDSERAVFRKHLEVNGVIQKKSILDYLTE